MWEKRGKVILEGKEREKKERRGREFFCEEGKGSFLRERKGR